MKYMPEEGGKHFYGAVLVGERGQIVIPKDARKNLDIKPGDKLIVMGMGHSGRGLMLLKGDMFRKFAERVLKQL